MNSSRSISLKLTSLVKKLSHQEPKIAYHHLAMMKGSKVPQVRRGCVAMYVGEEGKRYEVPLKYLSNPSFQELIMQSEQHDLDKKIDGPIRIPCSTAYFDQFLKQLPRSVR